MGDSSYTPLRSTVKAVQHAAADFVDAIAGEAPQPWSEDDVEALADQLAKRAIAVLQSGPKVGFR